MMGKLVANLASDTETTPTPAMRQAIAQAEVGDEQKGTDPTVNQLLVRVADLLGKEAALFFPGGTMCNHVAIKVHTRPGDAILADHMAHILRAESAGAAVGSGVYIEPIPSERGVFTPEALAASLAKIRVTPEPYAPHPSLVCVEQTHNFGGGAVWPIEDLRALSARARAEGLALHMDGARLMNAVIASGTPAADFAACVDSVWLDFTKGLGAPLGAVLAGTRAFIQEARHYKHVYGGALRQAGIVAAGCLYALDHHVERLAEDHANARRLAEGLAAIDGIVVKNPVPETNILFFNALPAGIESAVLLDALGEVGVSMSGVGADVRAVTHLDVSREGIEVAIQAVSRIVHDRAPVAHPVGGN